MAHEHSAAPAVHASDKAGAKPLIVGSGEYRYEVQHDWGELPSRIRYGNTHGVKVDSQGLIYVHHTVHETSESADSMVVFDPDGKFVKSWGSEYAGGAHGLHIVEEEGQEFLWLCDTERCDVYKTTLDGEVLLTLGYPSASTVYQAADDADPVKYKPTNVAVTPDGTVFVADGYGSSFINVHNAAGEYQFTFGGGETDAEGDLKCPHGLIVDTRGDTPVLIVADRGNRRQQYFTLAGEHIMFGDGIFLPCHFDIAPTGEVLVPDLAKQITLLDRQDRVITHLCAGEDDWKERRLLSRDHFEAGKFVSPHGACFDHEGNIFVVEWVEVGRVTKLRKVS